MRWGTKPNLSAWQSLSTSTLNKLCCSSLFFLLSLLCHFQKPLVSVLQSPASPPTLLEANGIFKRLSKMHASPALPSPSYPILNFYFCFAHTTSLSLSIPYNKQTHTHTYSRPTTEKRFEDKHHCERQFLLCGHSLQDCLSFSWEL